MRITHRQTPAHAIMRLLAILLRLSAPRFARPSAQPRPDDTDLAQRVRLSGEW